MLDLWGSLLNGIIAGMGMFIVSVIFGFLIFRLAKPWLTKTLTEIWSEVRSSGLEVELKIDGKHKKKKKDE